MKPEFVHDKSDSKNTFSVKYYRFAMLNVCEDMAKIKVELVTERGYELVKVSVDKISYENTCTVYIEDRVRVSNGNESVNVLVGKKRYIMYELVTLGTSYHRCYLWVK